MVIDLHVHVLDLTECKALRQSDSQVGTDVAVRYFMKHYGISARQINIDKKRMSFHLRVLQQISNSELTGAVLLALDNARNTDGQSIPGYPAFTADNDFVADCASGNQFLLFGASVHPYRKDALDELERLVERGACLIKWLPSAQNIDPGNPRCIPFFDAMARLKIPLLSHTGMEHTVSGGDWRFNTPEKLIPALERGVCVIAAHCGKRLLLHERSFFDQWKKMAQEYKNFYGDIGAFLVPTRLPALREIAQNTELSRKVLYGSDFPMVPWTTGLSFITGRKKATNLSKLSNPFDRAWKTVKATGIPDEVFSRAVTLLKIPDSKLISSADCQGRNIDER